MFSLICDVYTCILSLFLLFWCMSATAPHFVLLTRNLNHDTTCAPIIESSLGLRSSHENNMNPAETAERGPFGDESMEIFWLFCDSAAKIWVSVQDFSGSQTRSWPLTPSKVWPDSEPTCWASRPQKRGVIKCELEPGKPPQALPKLTHKFRRKSVPNAQMMLD